MWKSKNLDSLYYELSYEEDKSIKLPDEIK